jgi:hypothetical protein
MTGDGFFNRVNGFELVVANATAGDAGGTGDLAFLQDSAGNDMFLSRPEFGVLSGDGFYYRANGFDMVVAQALAGNAGGPGDQAFLQDSAGNDTFLGHPEFGVLSGSGFKNRANGFDLVVAQAVAGDAGGIGDQAFLQDSAGDDTFLGEPEFGVLSGNGFKNRANGFDLVVAQAFAGDTGGLGDQAFLRDSAGNDIFFSRPTFSALIGDGFRNRVNGFDRVAATADAGDAGGVGDLAQMFDSIDDDLFFGRGEIGSLSGNGFQNWASGFDDFFADATAGGEDTLNVDSLLYSLTHVGWEIIV